MGWSEQTLPAKSYTSLNALVIMFQPV